LTPKAGAEKTFRSSSKPVHREDGTLAGYVISPEYKVERVMGGKLRSAGLSQMRNGINVRNHGDKSYGSPEFSPDFYKLEGVVTGQTQRVGPVTQNRLTSSDYYSLTVAPSPKRTLWTVAKAMR
jgi:hypothetical protein